MLSQLYWSSYYTNNSRCGLTSMRICRVKGRSIDDVLTIKNSEIAKHLSLPPVKLHCSMLAEDAIKAAVKDIQAKRAKAAQPQTGGMGEEMLAAAGAS